MDLLLTEPSHVNALMIVNTSLIQMGVGVDSSGNTGDDGSDIEGSGVNVVRFFLETD